MIGRFVNTAELHYDNGRTGGSAGSIGRSVAALLVASGMPGADSSFPLLEGLRPGAQRLLDVHAQERPARSWYGKRPRGRIRILSRATRYAPSQPLGSVPLLGPLPRA